MANSTLSPKPAKPRPDFPLFSHANGHWAKKVRGKLHYFGPWAHDRKGEAAVILWLDQKDDLLAGRTPRVSKDGFTVGDLCNHFLTAKEQQRDAGELTGRSFSEYFTTCKIIVDAFGKTRLVDDLNATDFQSLRASLAKNYGVYRLSKLIQIIRSVFKYGYEADLIEKPVKFGPQFKRPGKMKLRAHKQQREQEHGKRSFTAAEIRQLIDKADGQLKAMILLGINCGFGNHDCGSLPLSAVNLETKWVDFPRPKTAVPRRCPLWPETVKALKASIATRPAPKDEAHNGLVFITKYGQPWAKDTADSPVAKEFRKLVDDLKLHRHGVGFYGLRHAFETVGGDSRDQVAVDFIMGHIDASMAGEYRDWISDDRLKDVVKHIHKWLFATKRAK